MVTYNVSGQQQLNAAVASLKDGDTILLAGGSYDLIKLRTSKYQDHSFDKKVTIASADPNNPAVVAELNLSNVENVVFSGIKFDYDPAKTSSKPFYGEKLSNVIFDKVTFEGEVVGGFGAGLGLRIKDSHHVTVSNSVFSNFKNGTGFSNMSDVALLDNDVRGMSADGFTFGGMNRVLIAGNDFRGYKSPDPDSPHKDNIQFRTGAGETASSDVIIRDNVMVDAEARHGIFMGNESYRAGDDSVVHTRVTIENNYLQTSQTHGITVFHGEEIDILNNVLVKNPEQTRTANVYTPLINVSRHSSDVLIQGNTVASVPTPQNDSWTVVDNITSGKRYLHWDGSSETANDALRPEADDLLALDPEAEMFRIDAAVVKGVTVATIDQLDFAHGDSIYLSGFNAGVFQGVTGGNQLDIWNDGGAVRIDSALDLQELSDLSPKVTGRIQGDSLRLIVYQGEDTLQLVLKGMASAWSAADLPDLY